MLSRKASGGVGARPFPKLGQQPHGAGLRAKEPGLSKNSGCRAEGAGWRRGQAWIHKCC